MGRNVCFKKLLPYNIILLLCFCVFNLFEVVFEGRIFFVLIEIFAAIGEETSLKMPYG